jgi:type IV secretion system protein VirB3
VAAQLEEVTIEEAATRPPMFMGLPRKLSSLLLCIGSVLFVVTASWTWEVIEIGGIAIIWFSIKPLVATDYHGFDIFLVWLRLDAMSLDRREWRGTRATPFPLRVAGPYGMTVDV